MPSSPQISPNWSKSCSNPSIAPSTVCAPDPEGWDQFVDHHPEGNFLQSSAWGAVKALSGWQTQRLGVGGGGGDAELSQTPSLLRAGAQLLFQRRYGVSIVYVPRGPLFSGDAATDTQLLHALIAWARSQRAIVVRIEPPILEFPPFPSERADAIHSWLLCNGFTPVAPIQPRSTLHLDLTPPPGQLFAQMSKGHRADIRRAEREGVRVRVGGPGDIATFYAILEATGKRATFPIHSAAYYFQVWHQTQPYTQVLLAEHADQAIAAVMVLTDRKMGYYLYGGAKETGLRSGANHLLQWKAIQWVREQGCGKYDFWGIPDRMGCAARASDPIRRKQHEAVAHSNPLIGVYRFKKGFGGTIVRYLPAYDYVLSPLLYWLWRMRVSSRKREAA